MNWIKSLFTKQKRSQSINDIISGIELGLTGGTNVTAETALTLAPFFQGVRLISEACSLSIPLNLYQDTDKGRTKITNDTYRLLNRQANNYMTGSALREFIIKNAIVTGNGFAVIVRDSNGVIVELLPLASDAVTGYELKDFQGRKVLIYDVQIEKQKQKFLSEEIYHLANITKDGVWGYSVIELFKRSLGGMISKERHDSTQYDDDGIPRGVLEYPGQYSEEDTKNLLKVWHQTYGNGPAKYKVALLQGGVKFSAIASKNTDSQYLELRQMDVITVARMLNIPPSFLYEYSTGASYTSLEHATDTFLQFTLNAWLRRIENECWRKLLSPSEKETMYFEHNDKAFVRTDVNTRFNNYIKSLQWSSINEIRRSENMETLPDSKYDEVNIPLNKYTPGGNPETSKVNSLPLLNDIASRIDRRMLKAKDRNEERQYVMEAITPIAESFGFDEGKKQRIVETYIKGNVPLLDIVNEGCNGT